MNSKRAVIELRRTARSSFRLQPIVTTSSTPAIDPVILLREISNEFSAGRCDDRSSCVPAGHGLRRSGRNKGARLELRRFDESNADLGFRAVGQHKLVLRGVPYAQ